MSSPTFFVPEFAKVNKGKPWFHRLHRDGLREVARDKDKLSGSGIQGCDEFRRLGYAPKRKEAYINRLLGKLL